jgi:predicted transcriptional regulator
MDEKKRGRKNSMNETLKKVAVNLAQNQGLTDKEIALSLGICETTIHNTKKYDESFFKALKEAKEVYCNNIVEDSLLKRCTGMIVKEVQTRFFDGKEIKTVIDKELPPDSSSLALYLRNRMPEKYCREKQNVNIEVENQKGLSREEALEIIRNDPFAVSPK